MMAAVTAGRRGLVCAVLERNGFTGKKLGITGKGRCNVCNSCPPEDVIKNTPGGGKFLYSCLMAFSPADTMRFFEENGLRLKVERGNRVFPESDKARDVVETLRRLMRQAGVKVIQGRAVEILSDNSEVTGVRLEDGAVISCKACILCTGGRSYPLTGSTGDGYRLAEALGHTVTPLRGSITGLESEDPDCGRMQGLALKNVKVKAFSHEGGGKAVFEDFGEALFTHYGLSGPCILSMSAHLRDFGTRGYFVSIDLKPALDEKKLDARLLRDFEEFKNRTVENGLAKLLPAAMQAIAAERAGIKGRQVNSVTREERRRLADVIKDFRIELSGLRPVEEAVVTSGGVELSGINPKTMESKLCKGLYFAGEIIDADAYTGGFNLQIAWSTAYAAGMSVLNG
jgi:predicted Rossmann fold flavoprotein